MRRNFLKIAGTSILGLIFYPLTSLASNLVGFKKKLKKDESEYNICLLYTSDAADEEG